MSPGVQSRHDTPSWRGHEERECLHPRSEVELLLSVTGEAEAGSAGEQPAEE